jgi:chaperone BCS1
VHPLRSQPRKLALVVLEDVDALFASRDATPVPLAPGETSQKPSVTFSGLLNALDGAGAPESVLIIMTTNHPERLDAALVRAGRVDRRFEFCAPTDAMIKKMLRRFIPDADDDDEACFVRRCRAKSDTLSLALVQEEARLYTKKC